MLIHVWSTPRTGSIWYSHWTQQQNPGSLLLTEPFNRNHMDMYHMQDNNGCIVNYHHPVDGGFYTEYFLDDKKFLNKRKVYGERTRSAAEEEHYIYELLKDRNQSQTLVIHNHIEPLNEEIRDYLLGSADKHIWLYRRDKKRQLASYAVALDTKKFAAFTKQQDNGYVTINCNINSLINLLNRVKFHDSIPKIGVKHTCVAFEDINFFNGPGLPFDQNGDPWIKISSTLQNTIFKLVNDYGYN